MAPQREWFEKDYYRVLGVSDTASQKDIRSAYRKLSRQYHPDANPDDQAAEERFKEVSAAYDVVGDAEKRKEYASASTTSATGATSWVGCSGAAVAVVARRGPVGSGARGRTVGRTWSPSCTWPSRTRCTG